MSIGSRQAGLRTWLHSNTANAAVCVSSRLGVMCEILARLKVPEAEIAGFRAFVENGDHAAVFDIVRICALLKTKYLVCSNVRESRGFALLASADAPYKCFFETPPDVRSRMQHGNSAGVVDAALAGFIYSYADLARQAESTSASLVNDKTKSVFRGNILDFVERASESEGATPGSVISFEEQASEQSRLAKLWRLTKRLRRTADLPCHPLVRRADHCAVADRCRSRRAAILWLPGRYARQALATHAPAALVARSVVLVAESPTADPFDRAAEQ